MLVAAYVAVPPRYYIVISQKLNRFHLDDVWIFGISIKKYIRLQKKSQKYKKKIYLGGTATSCYKHLVAAMCGCGFTVHTNVKSGNYSALLTRYHARTLADSSNKLPNVARRHPWIKENANPCKNSYLSIVMIIEL